MEELLIKFAGAEEDGLAARHSGQNNKIGGNALEALELFTLAIQINSKYVAGSASIKTCITDTGDTDMIKVPSSTSVKVILDENNAPDMNRTLKRISAIAEGTALMAGCTALIENKRKGKSAE